jgi:hypothetical protein
MVFLSLHATVDRVAVQPKAAPVLTAIRMTGIPDFIHKYYAGHCFAMYTNISCKMDICQHNILMSSLPVFVSLLGLSLYRQTAEFAGQRAGPSQFNASEHSCHNWDSKLSLLTGLSSGTIHLQQHFPQFCAPRTTGATPPGPADLPTYCTCLRIYV